MDGILKEIEKSNKKKGKSSGIKMFGKYLHIYALERNPAAKGVPTLLKNNSSHYMMNINLLGYRIETTANGSSTANKDILNNIINNTGNMIWKKYNKKTTTKN